MSEATHTPGPWEFVPAGNKPVVQQVGKFPSGFICTVESLNFVSDAQLISAAPDLLRMLKFARVVLDFHGGIDLIGIDAAIAKAEGGNE